MAVYVDELVNYRGAWWCHLTADSPEELREFARKINLHPSWIQREGQRLEHFDLRGHAVRRRAIAAGAIVVSARELARRRIDEQGSNTG